MKKKLANNLSLKVISVLIACVIWILVSGTVDPVLRCKSRSEK